MISRRLCFCTASFLHTSPDGNIVCRVKEGKTMLKLLSERHATLLRGKDLSELEEIRLRVGQPLLLMFHNREERYWPTLHQFDLEHTIACACKQSVYAYTETIRNGFVTVEGGHRIGICGFGVTECGQVRTIRSVSSLSIRVAREVFGCADDLVEKVGTSFLIIGPPGCGKTTLLRDLIRQLSDKKGFRVAIADERGEISAGVSGVPQLQVGSRTDVLLNVPKAQAAIMLLRTMNPQWIAVDEITSAEDISAMEQISYCGVNLIATAHANGIEDLQNRPLYRSLIQRRIFPYVAVLNKDKSYTVEEMPK